MTEAANSNTTPVWSELSELFGSSSSAGLNYLIDAAQRGILFWDVMGERAEQYREHLMEEAPHVLKYESELIIDGRTLERPVNYALVRITPPDGVMIDEAARPFVVVDPRAGHGPGIGGFKADSEIGVAFKAGHPCYFVGFLPDPVPGQTIEDVAVAEAQFLERVIALHPKAQSKPCVIGNCQAGWAIMMLAAMRPELFGSLIIAGAPLSYWAGVKGQYPMRYSGGLMGGSWLTAMTSDLGAGKFDGAWLVKNFEAQNPSNTYWTKQYNLYSKIDTEASRYLEFEKWWGGHVDLNAEEIQFIVDELFIGNNLAAGRIKTSNGDTVDLRNIRAPIVVFCSQGDNVTPPQQALDWILDLYDDVDEIRSHGQTIVYTVHETVGHLGIFVSRGVAQKEHGEFASNIDLIDVLPPGLYEAVLEPRTGDTNARDLVSGDWIMRCRARSLDDIRALGGNDAEDERRFETAAKVSERNLALYRTYMQPFVQAAVRPAFAEAMRARHPLRRSYEAFARSNPYMAPIADLAAKVRQDRKPVAKDNPFLGLETMMSDNIVKALDAWRDMTEKASEATFMAVYGSPAVQAAVGVDPSDDTPPRKARKTVLHRYALRARVGEIAAGFQVGGLREALVRSMLYVGAADSDVDERGFAAIKRLRELREGGATIDLGEFKALVREQFLMLLVDAEAALEAIPQLLPDDADQRREGLAALKEVLETTGKLSGEGAQRWRRITSLFNARQPAEPEAPPEHAAIKVRAKYGRGRVAGTSEDSPNELGNPH